MPRRSTTSEADKTARAAALQQSHAEAMQTLKDNHEGEYNTVRQMVLKEKFGIDWSPRLSPEQKAEAEFERLLAEHPEFAWKVASLETAPE